MKNRNYFLHIVTPCFAALSILALTGCPGGGGGGEITTSNGPGAGGGGSLTVTVSAVYPTSSGSSWSSTGFIDNTGMYYIKGNSLSIDGTCSRGVTKVVVSSSGTAFAEQATCDTAGNFTWTRSFTAGAEVNYTLSIDPADENGTIFSGSSVSKLVRVDDAAPTAPSITAPSAPPTYTATGNPGITMGGTIAADVTRIVGPGSDDSSSGSTQFNISGTNWTFPITLVANTSTAYTFTAYDRAGNSAASSLTITYTPSIALKIAGAYLGGSFTDSSTSYSLEASAGPAVPYAYDSGTTYNIETGLNRIVNQVRSDQ